MAFLLISLLLMNHVNSKPNKPVLIYSLPESRQELEITNSCDKTIEPTNKLKVVHKELEETHRKYAEMKVKLAESERKIAARPSTVDDSLKREVTEIADYMHNVLNPEIGEIMPYVEYVLNEDNETAAWGTPEDTMLSYETLVEFSLIINEFVTKLTDASTEAREVVFSSMRRNWGDEAAEVFISEVNKRLGSESRKGSWQ